MTSRSTPNPLHLPFPFLLLLVVTSAVVTAQTADIEIRMNEERPVGSVVVDVSKYTALFLEVSADDRPKLTFNILDKASFDASFFAIDSGSGVITMAKRLDRESACGSQESCHVLFNVAIQGSQGLSFSNIASIKVYIDDVNDNAPSFAEDRVVLEVSEAAKVGYVLKLRGPQDPDSPPNNTIQRYELSLQEPVFSVSSSLNPDGSTVLSLRLETELDRETTSEYDFNITAFDGGVPPKSGTQRVLVRVTDDNDNAPVFESKTYTVNVREDAAPGSEVVRVRASDRDAGEFGTVRYRFSSLVDESVSSLFQINSTSGSITLKSQIGHATVSDAPYTLVVEAFDGGDPPSVAQAVVTVTVINTGNNAPVVRIVTVSEGDTSEIFLPESAEVDGFVAFVNVEDRDEGRNGAVTCSMAQEDGGGQQFRLKTLPNKGYQVLLALPVDRELVSSYDAAILCRDGGSPPLSTEASFTVVITDVNDNDPSFDEANFSATVPENNAEGQYLLQVTARDRDSGPNAQITYGLVEEDQEGAAGAGGVQGAGRYVSVHAETGVVRAKMPLDRELTPVIKVTLTAVDGGAEARTGTAGLTIRVTDINDNSPQLLHLPYHFQVSEGALPGHVVAKMAALDVDEGINGQVEFFFAGSVSGEVPFAVHTNGTITVSGVLDRETSDAHVFTVLARDKGTIPRSNSTQVTIRVTDINDNAPVILFPTSVNHSVVITTLPEQGITLGRVIAYDVDEGNASSLNYVIHSGDAQGVFDIDPEQGEIFLADLKRLRNPHTYQVVLRVYDRGPIPLFAETSLQIEVNFPNTTLLAGGGGGDSSSGGAEGEEDDQSRDSYVIIVGVIGGATLVLSGVIIGAILFVLRSERQRKPSRDSMPVFKNDYVPAPTGIGIPADKMESQIPNVRSHPASSASSSSSCDVSASGVVLSPQGLSPHGFPQQKGVAVAAADVPKKVSFSFDEPDGEGRQLHSQEMLLVPISQHGSSPHPHPHPHLHGREAAAASMQAWKRMASPDDLNSDTSGDSGTCDSGRGASDDDIHLDSGVDKHGGKPGGGAPPLTNTNRTPARQTQAQAQANHHLHHNHHHHYPTSSATFSLGTFSPLQENPHHHQDTQDSVSTTTGADNDDEDTYAMGAYLTGGEVRPRPSTGTGTGRPSFLQHSGSYHEGRNDHTYPRAGAGGGGGKIRPRRPSDQPPHPHHHHPHPHHPQHPPGLGSVVSLHPETKPFWQGQGLGQGGGGGERSRRSLDLVENRRGGGGGGGPWLPPRSSSSLSYQRQGSAGGLSVEDDASTTTSGSYTITPEELRLEGHGHGHGHGTDVIV
ncbi:protocadherin-1-like [Babylonia areolata]|uniref:protocadherin-1-like n=1 Tax=Babylonia areolata TaxID=304850 RepID=UPI003FD1CB82